MASLIYLAAWSVLAAFLSPRRVKARALVRISNPGLAWGDR